MATLDFDMGLQDSMMRRMAELGRARDGFVNWLVQNPRHAFAYLGADESQKLSNGELFISITDFISVHEAEKTLAACRAQRLEIINDADKREQNALRYAVCKKLIWFAHGQPKAQP